MKTRTTIVILLVTMLLLSACNTATNSSQATQVSSPGSTLPELPRLVTGIFKLIDSDTPITKDEAGQLVILWKAYLELQTRDTTHPQEVSDLLNQINNTLTIEQQSAVTAMNLTFSDVMMLARDLGVDGNPSESFSGPPASASSSSQRAGMGGNSSFPGGGGGMPPNMGGGGMPPDMPGGAPPIDAAILQPPEDAGNRAVGGVLSDKIALALIDPLIGKLEAISGND